MSAYEDAVAYLDAEVHPRCDYDIYSDMRDIVDDMQAENAKLRELVTEAIRLMQADGPDCGLCKHYSECWTGEAMDYSPSGCVICTEARELGIEVE